MRVQTLADVSQVAEARRAATELATQIGFDDSDTGRVALVATELATNVLKHASSGEMLISTYDDSTGSGIELIALDQGPGITNVSASLRDGYSSAGTAGHGLGAIRRQSQVMEIATWPSVGTAVLARISAKSDRTGSEHPPWGGLAVPHPGEEVCGDAWLVLDGESSRTLLVADGLGHGADAAAAANEAVRLFRKLHTQAVPQLLESLHLGLRSTRGAAIALARFDHDARVTFGGIGNIAGAVIEHQQIRRMVSMSGTAGHNARKIHTFDYQCSSGLVIMASDGLSTHWSFDKYPGLTQAHPSLIAAVLYRDHSRRRDDVTVLVCRRN
ncbi:MAG TPA: ATP-binding SpoIIE family protein phosphatase [Steroidobacteraceae bacterium]|nr:ATP-binding SpoIIE family protein phosphatase [Steroidobacteraceae bacterium]